MNIQNIRKNIMGGVSFDGKFAGMRKPQDFIVYPVKAGDDASRIMVQSDNRIGFISMIDGKVDLAGPIKGGAYNIHLGQRVRVGKLEPDELLVLKGNVFASASAVAGKKENGFVSCDNSGAAGVFNAGSAA